MSRFRLSREALADIREISEHISNDSLAAADRGCGRPLRCIRPTGAVAGHWAHTRTDPTNRPVVFWPVGAYLVIYQRDVRPVHVVAVLHGKRDVKKILRKRGLPPGA